MSAESPEEVLQYIFAHIREMPEQPNPELRHSTEYKQQTNKWFGGRFAADFDYADLFMIKMIVGTKRPPNEIEIPPALVVNFDAYLYIDDCLLALVREADGLWKLRIALSTCYGCFGNHSFSWGYCWSVLCKCCGGTGWQMGNLEFYTVDPLPIDPNLLISGDAPRETFLHLLEKRLPALQPVEGIEQIDISPASVRGDTAKIEVTTSTARYLALMNKTSTEQWHLSAFLPLCSVCGGTGQALNDYLPCPACGGLKWGLAGELRYCRNNAKGWWEWQE